MILSVEPPAQAGSRWPLIVIILLVMMAGGNVCMSPEGPAMVAVRQSQQIGVFISSHDLLSVLIHRSLKVARHPQIEFIQHIYSFSGKYRKRPICGKRIIRTLKTIL